MTHAAQQERRRFKHPFGYRRSGDLFYYHEMTNLYYQRDMRDFSVLPVNMISNLARIATTSPLSPYNHTQTGRAFSASFEIAERITRRYRKPSFDINVSTSSTGRVYDIKEEVIDKKPFCRLIHFAREEILSEFSGSKHQKKEKAFPKVLIATPYSGHYATLLRDTVSAMLKDHDVYITDWENARDVPLTEGAFTLEDYIQYLIDFVRFLGTDLHILAVCQPAVPVLAMTALMASHKDSHQPKSMTLMGGPIDTRKNPTKANKLAQEKPLEWFKRSVIARVPHYYTGAFRRVVPGFLMLSGFMSMNLERHISSQRELFNNLIVGDEDSAEAHRRFYDEYRSVLDLPADYYLDSVHLAFQTHALPKGEMTWRGELVDTKAIEKTALLTVEGERDDISGIGQTKAAHDITPNLSSDKKQHYEQKKVGHYGVFNGRRWREHIVPVITDFIQKHG